MLRNLRVVIADDEHLARRQLARLLADIPSIEVVEACGDGGEAMAAITRHKPDIAFIDIEMPNVDGLAAIRSTPVESRPAIVLVTAHDQYALEAFSLHVVDYLLKPVAPRRLANTVDFIRSRIANEHEGVVPAGAAPPPGSRGPFLDRIAFRVDERLVVVPVSDIDYVQADGNYLNVYTTRARYRVRGRVGALESQLDPRHFVRIHRSTIVALDRIVEVQPWFRGELVAVLRNQARCNVGGSYRARLLALIVPAL